MPKAFNRCVNAEGSRTRTISLPGGKYMHVCYMNGKSYRGEIHKKNNSKKKNKRSKRRKRNRKK